MRKIFQITVLVFLLAGCGSLKQGWNNFTAYYNTFYNAKKFYNSGLEKNRNQQPQINPLVPIRVNPSPTDAGLEDFDKAIEKGSAILRDHDNSKFVVPALFIIGKSYYHRSDFFAALEKFQELDTIAEDEQRQEAVVWLGLTYLEMSNYDQGVEVLEFELSGDDNWLPKWRAEAQLVLGELHTELENWEMAANYLEMALSGIEQEEKRAKTRFLLGQVFENMDELSRALFSYSQINDLRTDFDLEFNAIRKQAEVSREIGNYDYAVSIYQRMRRDDKFLEYRSDLQYEIARTLQLKGDQAAAVQNYNSVLRNRIQPPTDFTLAKTYYGLGEIYRDEYQDLGMAAAYFDSAASQRVDESLLDDDFDARELARSYGEYVSIKENISRRDSLLNLAELDEEELDAFLDELREQELEKMEEELEEIQDQRDQMLVADQSQEPVQAVTTTEYGFLNIESATRLADASLQFQATWGDRPLADNWRRRSAVSGSRFDQVHTAEDDSSEDNSVDLRATGIQPTIDTSEIPFSQEAKNEMYAEIESYNYRLGNLFFLSLDMPDSAGVYYQKVANSGYDEDLAIRSLYSIAEVKLLLNQQEEAENLYEQLKAQAPNSIYTERLAERLGVPSSENIEDENRSDLGLNVVVSDSTVNSAQTLTSEVMVDSSEAELVRPFLLLNEAKTYMQKGRNQPGFDKEFSQWFEEQQEIDSKRNQFEELKDSARVMLADTTLDEARQQYWQQIADSTFKEPEITENYPFEGAYWDSTRSILQEIETEYSASTVMPQVQILRETLAKPSVGLLGIKDTTMVQDQEETEEITGNYPSCESAGITINLGGDMESFMNSLSYPEWTQDVSIRGELEYLFVIAPDGTIQSYEQLSRMDRSGIPQALESGIETNVTFDAHSSDEPVECTIIFPFNL